MTNTHLHLLLNHFPIVGSIIATLILIYGYWKNDRSLVRVSLLLFSVLALVSIAVLRTGHSAEDTVENLPGVSESMLEEHEDAAQWAFWLLIATGALSLLALFLHVRNHPKARNMTLVVLIFALFATTAMIRTGYLGGQIRHSEIRGESLLPAPENKDGKEHHDEK